ncbi:ABC transporter substrate-binding protein [Pseudonocardia sp. C8]|uniref:ABC transporter substrate-binding protein n=1 Tax=Pseudonocardia sp. C8 TaxID=2762759 RepID=UPI00164289C0|nr:ABC transporter substrate-binding protein [Pseudonocardia sp. C8]MBC3191566.1 ABC transporter substrate-binding protein [Pseudonocardia sp. C8]
MTRSSWRIAALAGVASLVLAGCGGGGGEQAGSGEGAGTGEAPSAAGQACTPAQAQPTGNPGTAPLKIGSLLPETGSLAFLGPPEFAGVEVALEEVNAGGGVLGQPIQHLRGDSGDDTTDIANQTVDRHLGAGTQVIVGAAASGVSKLVIDKIAGAGVVQFSPANTSDEFTCWQDRGMYFRTAPPDVLQGQALAQLITSDGGQRVSLLARNDPYGSGLANSTERNLVNAGIPQDQIQKLIYDPNAASFNPEIDQVAQFNPDAIAVIGFDESKRILTRMTEVRIGPSQKRVYGTDGNMGNALGEGLPPGLLNGMKGTLPLTELSGDFQNRLKAQDPALTDFNYAAESYDAVVLSALAAEAAKSTNGPDIATQINAITKGGEKCTTYAACKAIVARGGDVDYDGATGTLDFTDAGEPGSGSYGVQTFDAQNKISPNVTYVRVGAQG